MMKKLLLSAILTLLVISAVSFAGPLPADASLGIWMDLGDVVGDTYSISVHRLNLNASLKTLAYDISVSEQAYISAEYTADWDTDPGVDNSTPAHGAVAQLLNSITFDSQKVGGTAFAANTTDVVEIIKLQITDTTTPRWIILDITNIVATDENGDTFENVWTTGGAAPSIAIQIVPEPATMAMLALGGLFLRRRKQA